MNIGSNIRRIAIVGAPGSGKSTLARRLAAVLSLPAFHMDHIHWTPGWIERARPEKISMAREILAQDEWILEGNLSSIQDERLARAQVLIWLDLRLGLRMWRVARRTVRWFGQVRPDMQEGCREGLNPEMIKFFIFIWQTRHSSREKIALSLEAKPDHLKLFRLRSPLEVSAFLDQLEGTRSK